VRLIRALPPGITELSCHPGAAGVEDPLYGEEREWELRTLVDPRVRTALEEEGVELKAFADLS
jgi:hypothetical protein